MPIGDSHTSCYESPLGQIILSAVGTALTGLRFDNSQPYEPAITDRGGDLPIFDEARHWLDIYFAGHRPDFIPPLALPNQPFRRAVLEELLSVPYGSTVSYKEIALRVSQRLGRDAGASARAIGNAVARNPILLIIPCHRVVGSDGRLTGYSAGLSRKAALLRLEQPTRPGSLNL